jgi:hypothetical protein
MAVSTSRLTALFEAAAFVGCCNVLMAEQGPIMSVTAIMRRMIPMAIFTICDGTYWVRRLSTIIVGDLEAACSPSYIGAREHSWLKSWE